MPLPSGLKHFCWEISWWFYGSSLVGNCLCLAAFKILFLSLTNLCLFNYDVSWCGPLWVHLVWDSPHFLDLSVFFSSPGWGSFQSLFLPICVQSLNFSSSPSGTPMIQMLLCLKLSQGSLNYLHFLKILSFLLFWSVVFCYLLFQITDPMPSLAMPSSYYLHVFNNLEAFQTLYFRAF